MLFVLEQKVTTKKNHACGSNQWIIKRVGADMKLECFKCGRQIMMKRIDLSKRIKKTTNI